MNIPVYKWNHRRVTRNTAIVAAILVAFVGLVSLLAVQRSALAAELSPDDFVTTWKTDNPGGSNNSSITVPGFNGYEVDWDNDGVFDETLGSYAIHDFGTPGIYTIRMRWPVSTTATFTFGSTTESGVDAQKLVDVKQWGSSVWNGLGFFNASNMVATATDTPNLSNLTLLNSMFDGAKSFNTDISNWDVSHATSMVNMFHGAESFNQPLSNWDVSNVTALYGMFNGAKSFNQPLDSWDTSKAVTISGPYSDSGMFAGATSFNQDISSWNISNVTDLTNMFAGASSFNQPLDAWDVSNITSMGGMFAGATSFNQPLNSWNVSNVENVAAMFSDAKSFNQPLSSWNLDKSTNFFRLFGGASAFDQDLSSWDVSNVTSMYGVFQYAHAFNRPLNGWNVAGVTTMESMFEGAGSFNQNLASWDTSSVTNMRAMFSGASAFNQSLSGWDVSHVTTMSYMFQGGCINAVCTSVFNQDLSSWNTAQLTDISYMFNNAKAFNQSLGGLDISSVENMSNVLQSSGVTTTQADRTMRGWATQEVKPGLSVGLPYCTSETARSYLAQNHGWIIGGYQACVTYMADSGNSQIILNASDAKKDASITIASTDVFTRQNTPYSLTCSQAGPDDSYFRMGGVTSNKLLLNTDLSYETAPDANQDGMYEVCVRTYDVDGYSFDTQLVVRVLAPKNITGVVFGTDGDGRKILTVNGASMVSDAGYVDGLTRSLVRLNGTDLRFCSDGFDMNAQQITDMFSPSFPQIGDNVTDNPSCYFLLGAGLTEVRFTPTQVVIWLDDNFDISAPGTVSIDNSTPFAFNTSNGGGETDPTAAVDGSKPLDQHPVIKPLPTFSGVAEPGAVVKVTVHSDPVICITTADSNGNWSCTLTSELPAGEHTVYIQVTNPDSSVENLGPYAVTVGGTVTNDTPTAPNTGVQQSPYVGIIAGILVLMSVATLGIVAKSSR